MPRKVERGDFVHIPEHISDDDLRSIALSDDAIEQLRLGQYVAGSLLDRGLDSEGGSFPDRGSTPGEGMISCWKVQHVRSGDTWMIPASFLEPARQPDWGEQIEYDPGEEFWLDSLATAALASEIGIKGPERAKVSKLQPFQYDFGY